MNQPHDGQLDALPGETGIPSLNQAGPSRGKRVFGFAAMLLALGLSIGGWTWWQAREAERAAAAAEQEKKKGMQVSLPPKTFVDLPQERRPLPGAEAPQNPSTQGGQATRPGTAPALPGTSGNPQRTATLDKYADGITTKKAGGQGAVNGQQPAREADEQRGAGGMSALLTSTRTDPRKATFMGNMNFMIAKGAMIDCALQTRLDSTVDGMTSCVVTRDIFSVNGKVLLIEKGSLVTGEYKSNMRQGMARIFVLWNRIRTPNGVIVNLDSPGTDPLGGAGVPGYVDNHFWQRFGGALMLSLVDDVARGITSQGNSSGSGSDGNQFNFNSTGEASQNMATEALRNTINIPPTLYKNQGDQVGIFVARDLDFSGVYDVTEN